MLLGLLALILLMQAQPVYADRYSRHGGGHYYRYHDRPRFGLYVSFVPAGYSTVWVGGARYHYYDGLYYNRYRDDYVIVAPPAGAVVRVIPPDYQTVIINGTTYYTDNGIYYVYTRYGYRVVPAPVVVNQQPVVVPAVAPSTEKFGISDVIVLSHSGVSDDAIIEKIARTGSTFRLSVAEVEALRKEGVSSRVVDYMLKTR